MKSPTQSSNANFTSYQIRFDHFQSLFIPFFGIILVCFSNKLKKFWMHKLFASYLELQERDQGNWGKIYIEVSWLSRWRGRNYPFGNDTYAHWLSQYDDTSNGPTYLLPLWQNCRDIFMDHSIECVSKATSLCLSHYTTTWKASLFVQFILINLVFV